MKQKNIILLFPFIIWIFVSLFEIISFFTVYPKPMYFRAWEFVSNPEGRDAANTPFKPLSHYDGQMHGDLLRYGFFQPRKDEYRHQLFISDEWGFRNKPHMLDKPIEAVVIGTSFAGGAADSQENTISDLLTEKYNIPTYSYTTQGVQSVWEDSRFKKNTPKYIIFADITHAIIGATWNYTLKDTENTFNRISWESTEAWRQANEPNYYEYDRFKAQVYRFSILRYFAYTSKVIIANMFLNRRQLLEYSLQQQVSYEEDSDNLYFQREILSPLFKDYDSTKLEKSIQIMQDTQSILQKRGIKMIYVAVPIKGYIQSSQAGSIPEEDLLITHLNQAMDKAGILHTSIYPDLLKLRKMGKDVYYKDDTHWNNLTSNIIAEKLAEIIRIDQLNTTKSINSHTIH